MNPASFKYMIRPLIQNTDEFNIALRLIEPESEAKIDISDIIENLQSKIQKVSNLGQKVEISLIII
jgi:hypothetical protein